MFIVIVYNKKKNLVAKFDRYFPQYFILDWSIYFGDSYYIQSSQTFIVAYSRNESILC